MNLKSIRVLSFEEIINQRIGDECYKKIIMDLLIYNSEYKIYPCRRDCIGEKLSKGDAAVEKDRQERIPFLTANNWTLQTDCGNLFL